MILADGVLAVLLVGFLLFCLLDVITSDPAGIRNLPKFAWILLVFLNPIGGIAWLVAGRPKAGAPGRAVGGTGGLGRLAPGRPARPGLPSPPGQPTRPDRGPRRRSVAPDDDPAFLAGLTRANDEHERMLGTWEDDLRRREEELRRRGDEGDAPA
jgi:hypothetical protein